MTRYRKNPRRALCLLLAAALSTGGCSLLPRSDYTAPRVDLPQQWQGKTTTGTAVASREKWWEGFGDPLLNELIERALKTNNDLAAAAIKVRRAQLSSRLTDTNLTPTVSVEGSSNISRDLKRHADTQTHSVTGSLSYEVDLWGRLAAARDSSRWEAQATEVDRQSTALSLIGTTAADYWQVAYLNQLIATSEASIAYAEKTLELVEVKYRAGAVSGIDLVQARQTVATQKADLASLVRQRAEARNALAILFDQAPEKSVPERTALPDGPLPEVAAGLPASLLGQRPDVHAAELRLREYLANVDATRANYYPTFTLTGSLGSSSTSLANVLQNPVAALGAGLTLPFLQWNTMRLNVKISEADYEVAVVNFRQTLYAALSDVENALTGRTQYEAEGKQLEDALALAKRSEQLAEVRYRAGYTAVQLWLDAQESRRSAEKTLAANRLNRLKNLMTLYQALGGEMGKVVQGE
ncbi:efflux transporter outer membrane subunit [Geobacter sp. AOG2]|uniref:efflux transporter outer membrane subunit n=1 Tax=Geobacter sp. AOG2 TaxID=1566347 RepID=UPI001CC4427E|nr:efflux transporter outer membrane subunit [Geobacter sp. AOG2]GFE62777.1 outer membrane efflux protein [Geobacter sp. AOG2]